MTLHITGSIIAGVKVWINLFKGVGAVVRSIFKGDLQGAIDAVQETIVKSATDIKDAFTGNFKDIADNVKEFYEKWSGEQKTFEEEII